MEPDDRIARRDEVPIEVPIRAPRRVPAAVVPDAPVRWGSVWTGFFVSLGILMLLTAAGIAVGGSALTGAVRAPNAWAPTLTTGAAIWAVVSFLIAVFVGSMVAARFTAGNLSSILEGGLVWVMSLLAVAFLAHNNLIFGSGTFATFFNPTITQAVVAQAETGTNPVATTGTYGTAVVGLPGAWLTFVLVVVSLVAAIFGALVVARRHAAVA